MTTTRAAAAAVEAVQDVPVTGVVPYLGLRDASRAVAFYREAFGAQVLARLPAEDGQHLMHCHLRINGGHLMLADPFPESCRPAQPPQGYVLHLQVDDVDAWWARALAAGAEVVMPLALQFWGDRYGQVRDPFGVTWGLGSSAR